MVSSLRICPKCGKPMKPRKYIITDLKTWGSYSVKKILEPNSFERFHNSLQLNDYRLKVEKLDFQISKMRWQITVRDGGTFTARNNGIEDKMLMIEADWMDGKLVVTYFYDKSKALLTALDKNELPELCPFEERWNGRRCKGSLCEVHAFCPEGAKINRTELLN